MSKSWYLEGNDLLKQINEYEGNPNEVAFWYIGQCGYIFKQNVTLVIDPVLSPIMENGCPVLISYHPPFPPDHFHPDYVLCTHGHIDHLAVATIRGIAEGSSRTRFIIPGGCKKIMLNAGIPEERILCAKAHHRMDLGDFSVYPISAAHPVHEVDEDGNDLALSYRVCMGNVAFLHLGDTYLTDQYLSDLTALPSPDIFMPPINGGDYFRTARDCIGNLSYLESAHLANLLKADLTVPTHYDMFPGNSIDPSYFIRALWEENSAAKFHLPVLGERFIYRKG